MKLYDIISTNLYDGEIITLATNLTIEEAERRLHGDPDAPDHIWGDCATTVDIVEVWDTQTDGDPDGDHDYYDFASTELYGAPWSIITENMDKNMIETFRKEVEGYIEAVFM